MQEPTELTIITGEVLSIEERDLVPLDARYSGAVALVGRNGGTISEIDRACVRARLDYLFEQGRSTNNREFSGCIAFAVGIVPVALSSMADYLRELGSQQNHGMLTDQDIGSSVRIWQGRTDEASFYISQVNDVALVMPNNRMLTDTTIFSLNTQKI